MSGAGRVRRYGVLGGTFDPPHLAHLALAAAAYRRLDLDRVFFVPAGDPWRKRGRGAGLSPAAVRLRLVRAAVEGIPWAQVDDIEVRRSGPSYTADTLEVLSRGGGDWWFILGGDALADMPRWHAPERIVAAARLAVARRPGAGGRRGLVSDALRERVPGIDDRIDIVPFAPRAVSSTAIRVRIAAGGVADEDVPARVRGLIEALGLYR